ncbi:MAG: RHS repeat-associated core domain-containing protein, partial [Mariprofundales bacterium]
KDNKDKHDDKDAKDNDSDTDNFAISNHGNKNKSDNHRTGNASTGNGNAGNAEIIYWHHNDHLGTPQAMTNINGTKVWDMQQTPFGITTINNDANGNGRAVNNNFRFPGQYFDAETGLNYNYFRTYDATIGKYTQSDPIGLNGGLNVFGYVGGRPVVGVDTRGLIRVHFLNSIPIQKRQVTKAICLLFKTVNNNSRVIAYFNKFSVDIVNVLANPAQGPDVFFSGESLDYFGKYNSLLNSITIEYMINEEYIQSTLIHELAHWANDQASYFGNLNPDISDVPPFMHEYLQKDGPYGYAAEIVTYGKILF